MTLCAAWLIYWGRKLGMAKREIMHTRVGEMLEMLDCHAIAQGVPAKGTRKLTTEEALMLK